MTGSTSEREALASFIADALAPVAAGRCASAARPSAAVRVGEARADVAAGEHAACEPTTEAGEPVPASVSTPAQVLLLRMGSVGAAVAVDEVVGLLRFSGAPPARCGHRGRELRVVDGNRLLDQPRAAAGGMLLVARGADVALACERIEGRRALAPGALDDGGHDDDRSWLAGRLAADRRCLLRLAALAVSPAPAAPVAGTEPASS